MGSRGFSLFLTHASRLVLAEDEKRNESSPVVTFCNFGDEEMFG